MISTTPRNPGYIFYPADIQYFIEFELKDKAEQLAASHCKVPTAGQYLIHCVERGLVPPDAAGRLYKRVFLKDYLHVDGPISDLIWERYGTFGVWFGDLSSFYPADFDSCFCVYVCGSVCPILHTISRLFCIFQNQSKKQKKAKGNKLKKIEKRGCSNTNFSNILNHTKLHASPYSYPRLQ